MPVAEPDVAVGRAEAVLDVYGRRCSDLIAVLQDLQKEFGYLPRPALEHVSSGLGLPMAELLRVATFYAAFSLEPLGEHLITVCMGTACHVRGAPAVLRRLEDALSVRAGGTTVDGRFTLKTVNCLGACALGPLVAVDGKYRGHMNPAKVKAVLEEFGLGRDDDQG